MKNTTSQKNHNQIKLGGARLSFITAVLLTILKFTVGLLTNSIGILSEAVNSLLDVLSSSISYVAMLKATEPADKTHPYGHGKFEDIAGIIQSIIIFFTGLYIVSEAIKRFLVGATVQALEMGIGMMFISMVASFLVSRRLAQLAKQTDSVILSGDSIHFGMDLYTGLGVFVALLLIRFTGNYFYDPLAAVIVCLIVLFQTYGIFKRAFGDLTDRGLPDEVIRRIKEVVKDHYPELIGFHDLRTRQAGAEKHIDLHLEVCKDTSLVDSHRLTEHLEQDIKIVVPRASVMIHAEPCKKNCQKCVRYQFLKRKI